jgi:thiol-disulfide isomerase/thioredoxin
MLKTKRKVAKNPIVYQLWYNRDMLDVNLQRVKTNPWLRGLLLIALIVLALWMARSEKYTFTPNTTFTTITDKHLALQDLQRKPVLITFWATSCGSCVKEIPHLIALYKQFHPQGLEIIAIAMVYDPPNQVVAMTKESNLPYHVVLDLTSEYATTFGRVWATPTTLLIGGDGTVAKHVVGVFDLTDMQNRIQHLLKTQ